MKEVKTPKKPLIFYYVIVIAALLVLNFLIVPLFSGTKVETVTYDVFTTMLEEKQVKTVHIGDSYVYFVDNGEKYYKTGLIESDSGLVDRLQASGCEYDREVQEETSPFLRFLIVVAVPLVIFAVLGQFLSKQMMNKMGGSGGSNPFMQFGKSNAKVYVASTSGITFDDVAGEDEAKEALAEIVDFLHNPQKYNSIGAKMPKGALLVGPPGTGKTMLAKAVAGEAKVPFFSISGSEFVEMFVGMGAAKVRDLFKQANEKAPCIVFIDEIDTIGKKRDSSGIGGNDEREQTLNQLLTEMDGFDAGRGVVILAATNRPETLDPALLRPGRFDRRIPVELPDLAGREAILLVHSKKIKMEDNVDLTAVARASVGSSGADLANLINEAALRAVRCGRDKVTQEDLEESVDVVVAGYQKKNKVMSDKEKLIVSYHETGHALVAALQTDSAPVTKITIIPRTSGALGYTMQVDSEEHNLMSRDEILNKIATLTGGRVAEEIAANTVTTGASNDIEQATRLARAMVTRFGMSGEFGMVALETVNGQYLGGDASLSCSAQTSAEIDREVIAIVKAAYEKAKALLTAHADKLNELAKYLYDKETVTGDEFMRILKGETPASTDED